MTERHKASIDGGGNCIETVKKQKLQSVAFIMQARKPAIAFEELEHRYGPYAIGLDGSVFGSSRIKKAERRTIANFDHHKNVDRLRTPATCGQIWEYVTSGAFETDFPRGENVNIFLNDCDPDVIWSTFLLQYAPFVKNASQELREQLGAFVTISNVIDISGGVSRFDPQLEIVKRLRWINDPYAQLRTSGRITTADSEKFREVIETGHHRIIKTLCGKGELQALDTTYEGIIYDGWAFVTKEGYDARGQMLQDGIPFILSRLSKPYANGNWGYSLNVLDPESSLNLHPLCNRLNQAEREVGGAMDWGGSNRHGGSPRGLGTKLTQEQLVSIITAAVSLQKQGKGKIFP